MLLALPIFTITFPDSWKCGSYWSAFWHQVRLRCLYSCHFFSSVPCNSALLTANRKDDELFRKVYFDLKEVGNELEALAVKVDKVPTLVDKIVSDSTKDLSQLNQLSSELSETKEELALKLARLEELATQEPPSPEPDPEIARANQAIADLAQTVSKLAERLDDIKSGIDKIPTEFPAPVIQTIPSADQPSAVVAQSDEQKENFKEEATVEEILTEDAFSPDLPEMETPNDPDDDLSEIPSAESEPILEEPEDRIDEENSGDGASDEKFGDDEELTDEPSDDDSLEELNDEDSESTEPKLEEETFDDLDLEEPEEESGSEEEEGVSPTEISTDEEPPPIDEPAELDLGLPAPEETLRKVDALLAGEPTTRLRLRKKKSPPRKHRWHDYGYCQGYDWYRQQTLCPRRRPRL